jgi:hypothetical protein
LAQINLDEAMISIKRAKDGKSGDHLLHGDDVRALRRPGTSTQPVGVRQ